MGKIRQVLLMTPPYHCGVVESAGRWLPLGLVYLAGELRRAGYPVSIYDAMSKFHGRRAITAHIAASGADVLALTANTSTVNACLATALRAKSRNPGLCVILGGVHPTLLADDLLRSNPGVVDYVVRGEGERTLPALLKALEAGDPPEKVPGVSFLRAGTPVHAPKAPFLDDLDTVHAAWDLLDWKDYKYFVIPRSRLGVISTSRGCTNECTFCSQQKFWEKTWRARSPGAVVEEIHMLHRTYGVNVFLIADEFPTRDQPRWLEILDRLIHAALPVHLLMETCVSDILRDEKSLPAYRRAGIVHVYVGVEATEQQTLDSIKKNITVNQSRDAIRLINAHNMISETSFILGFPEETPKTIAQTLKLAKYYNPDFAHFLAITPWPYADSYASLLPYIQEFDYGRYNLVEPIVKPRAMSLQQVENALFSCYGKFYISKLPEYDRMEDEFKREYLFRSMKVMLKSSFLRKKIMALGKMPEEVEKYTLNPRKQHP